MVVSTETLSRNKCICVTAAVEDSQTAVDLKNTKNKSSFLHTILRRRKRNLRMSSRQMLVSSQKINSENPVTHSRDTEAGRCWFFFSDNCTIRDGRTDFYWAYDLSRPISIILALELDIFRILEYLKKENLPRPLPLSS